MGTLYFIVFCAYLKLRLLKSLRHKNGDFVSQMKFLPAVEMQIQTRNVSQNIAFRADETQKWRFCISNKTTSSFETQQKYEHKKRPPSGSLSKLN